MEGKVFDGRLRRETTKGVGPRFSARVAYRLGRSVQRRRAEFVDVIGKRLWARRHRVAKERHTVFCHRDW